MLTRKLVPVQDAYKIKCLELADVEEGVKFEKEERELSRLRRRERFEAEEVLLLLLLLLSLIGKTCSTLDDADIVSDDSFVMTVQSNHSSRSIIGKAARSRAIVVSSTARTCRSVLSVRISEA